MQKKNLKDLNNFWHRKLTLKVIILPFLTTFTQVTARLKNLLRGWLLVLSLKEGLVECATVCVISEVILFYLYPSSWTSAPEWYSSAAAIAPRPSSSGLIDCLATIITLLQTSLGANLFINFAWLCAKGIFLRSGQILYNLRTEQY